MGRAPRRGISLREAKHFTTALLPAPLTRYHSEVTRQLQHFTPQHGSDKLLWNLSSSQIFSVNSAYRVLSQGGKLRSATTTIWKAKVTPSMRFFFYLFLHNRILTQEVMLRRGIHCEPICVMCGTNRIETDMHLFFHCTYAARVWSVLTYTEGYTILTTGETAELTYIASASYNRHRFRAWINMFITAVWMIWKERNERIFRNKHMPAPILINRIRQEAQMCLRYC